jgi:hypothetical protein
VQLVRRGDRFRVVRDVESHVGLVGYAPTHTFGIVCVVPAGTVVVALDQSEGASGFSSYAEDFDGMERVLIPEDEREDVLYTGAYYVTFSTDEIGDLLEPLEPLDSGPANRLPRVTGRPSPAQRAEQARRQELYERVASLEQRSISAVTESAWVRRNSRQEDAWEVLGPDEVNVPLESWDIWFDRPPGDPPRAPDVPQPGGARAVVGRIRDHDLSL